jgi:hypothetical protein
MTTRLGQLERVVEPKWVKALYRAGIGITNHGWGLLSGASALLESSCLRVQLKVRGKLLVRLCNTATTPIANKYREGKLK